ncbi:hypothetical protein F2Q69_00053631 [Brassica cretica]|uniref:Uncharacterized protein n=1 Tax=Brassica cretica TaxID=69181 RepID=A0A8S9N509_BRACR|nr:hypothetical protein F2Q69_00053631 [Brassica cretica]
MAVFGGANLGSVSFSSHLLNQHSCFLSCPLKLLPSSSSSSSNRTSLLCVVKSFSGSVTAGTDTRKRVLWLDSLNQPQKTKLTIAMDLKRSHRLARTDARASGRRRGSETHRGKGSITP